MDRDDIIRMARQAGFADGVVDIVGFEGFANFANFVAAHERVECAKWADLVAREIDNTNNTASYIASGIRERGEK